MSLSKILAITGKPGLYQLVSQTRSGFVAESLIDGKKVNVSMRHNVSMLNEIAIYTYNEEVPLKDVFSKIAAKESEGKTSVSHKGSKKELEGYFSEVLPGYDEERVYASDIKKVIRWYNTLQEKSLLNFEEEISTEEE